MWWVCSFCAASLADVAAIARTCEWRALLATVACIHRCVSLIRTLRAQMFLPSGVNVGFTLGVAFIIAGGQLASALGLAGTYHHSRFPLSLHSPGYLPLQPRIAGFCARADRSLFAGLPVHHEFTENFREALVHIGEQAVCIIHPPLCLETSIHLNPARILDSVFCEQVAWTRCRSRCLRRAGPRSSS
jgi:hypothetical protein